MSVIKGGDLMIFLGGSSIAFATNHTLNISMETKESTSKDSGGKWQTAEGSIISWTASTENLLSDEGAGKSYDDLFDLMVARTPVTAVFAMKNESADNVPEGGWTAKSGNGYTGSVLITSLQKNAQNGENATFTAEFQGVGELKKVTAA